MINDSDRDRILDRCRIEEVIEDFYPGVLKREGSRYKCCCPVHNERTPSFVVTPAKNTYKCFGCGIGGNAISFLMETQHLSYPEAIKYLAKKYHVELTKDEPKSHEDIEREQRYSAMLAANNAAAKFFAAQILAEDEKCQFAYNYAKKRWGENTIKEECIGYAPGRGHFREWAKKEGLSTELLLDLGLLKKNDSGQLYDGFYERIIIPIRNRSNQVIAFTARALADVKPKYINSPESIVFKKGSVIFGLQNAIRKGATEECFYLVEGGPDVLKLQSIGIYNTIAPLGTAWTDEHFKQLKRFNPTLCFIPDIDPPKEGQKFGAGINAVIKNGSAAMASGFRVIVKEIIPESEDDKVDPDSYIRSKDLLEAIPKEDFITWYATKLMIGRETASERAEAVKTIAEVLAKVEDKDYLKMMLPLLKKIMLTPVNLIQAAITEKVKDSVERKLHSGKKLIDQELYQKYGFFDRGNCYYSLGKDGDQAEWSNFTMTPLFHIKDQLNPKRLFKIKNSDNQSVIIEMKQEELCGLQKFKIKVEGLGNFIWSGSEEQLTKLKKFLYANTETATEITQLGWQRQEFYAFGNGVYYNGQWIKCDEYGIARIPDVGNFYLPASSLIYRDERKLFQFERRFIHAQLSEISFRKYSDKLIEVFGDNAKVGICFTLATIFKDVVTTVTKNFPILNLFGPKGSGKSELGHSLMSFFIIKNDPPNLSTATDAALADTVAQCANALVHIDEYKNTIELSRREFIKALYDGVGRTRMNMDRDKKRETTAVDCGVILSGQEMPTVDIAIFSRLLFLTFKTSEFTVDAKRKFDELVQLRDNGCTHLVLELLKHRKRVEADFYINYKSAMADIMDKLEGKRIEDRILRNWVIPLAIFRTLQGAIDVSFSYQDMLRICIEGIERQNKECQSTNELAAFWNTVDFLHQNGEIFIEADYRVKHERKFKGKGMREGIEFAYPKRLLYLCSKRIMPLYKKNAKATGDTALPVESLRFYLENSKEYLGTKNAVRFKNISNAVEATKAVEENGFKRIQQTSRIDWALVFDYEMIEENYGINLEVETDNDGVDPIDIDETDQTIPYE